MPHITDAIQDWIERAAAIPVDGKDGPADVCVVELGGTIGKHGFSFGFGLVLLKTLFFLTQLFTAGDIESMPFIEALGQFSYRVGMNIKLCLRLA